MKGPSHLWHQDQIPSRESNTGRIGERPTCCQSAPEHPQWCLFLPFSLSVCVYSMYVCFCQSAISVCLFVYLCACSSLLICLPDCFRVCSCMSHLTSLSLSAFVWHEYATGLKYDNVHKRGRHCHLRQTDTHPPVPLQHCTCDGHTTRHLKWHTTEHIHPLPSVCVESRVC